MDHPIGELMHTALGSIKELVDVNTVVGEPVVASSGTTVIPISRVSFGYAAAGGDLPQKDKRHAAPEDSDFPFAGGSGAGVSVQPVGFLVISGDSIRMIPAQSMTVADRMVELIPGVVEDVKNLFLRDNTTPGLM